MQQKYTAPNKDRKKIKWNKTLKVLLKSSTGLERSRAFSKQPNIQSRTEKYTNSSTLLRPAWPPWLEDLRSRKVQGRHEAIGLSRGREGQRERSTAAVWLEWDHSSVDGQTREGFGLVSHSCFWEGSCIIVAVHHRDKIKTQHLSEAFVCDKHSHFSVNTAKCLPHGEYVSNNRLLANYMLVVGFLQ